MRGPEGAEAIHHPPFPHAAKPGDGSLRSARGDEEGGHEARKELLSGLWVSHETKARLKRYAALVAAGNERMNLVSASTVPHLWERHILDSAQLFLHVPPAARVLVDIGSGAGFPGVVLAILGVPEVHVVESTVKKARFLEETATELGLSNVTVHPVRAEAVRGLKADVVTARAMAPLVELLPFVAPFLKPGSVALLPKGRQAKEELAAAGAFWSFTCDSTPSLTDPSGTILKIVRLTYRTPAHRRSHRR